MKNILRSAAILSLALFLSGCAALAVTDAVVGTTVFATKTVAKTTIGAGKLAVSGVGAAARAITPGHNEPAGSDCYELADGTRSCVSP